MNGNQNQPYFTPESFWSGNAAAPQQWGGFQGSGPMESDTGMFAGGNSFSAFQPNGGAPAGGDGGAWGWLGDIGKTMGGTSKYGGKYGEATFLQKMLGGIDTETKTPTKGWGGGALGLAGAGFGGYMAFKNMKMAQDALKFQKKSWTKNYEAQKHSFNENAASINAAREARAPGAGHRIKEL